MARPSKYTQSLADEICDRLSKGEPLSNICKDGKFPTGRTIFNWKREHPDFAEAYGFARDEGFDALAAEALRIADTPISGVTVKDGKDGIETTTEDMLGHRRLQVETRLKLLAKWDPRRYGDKLETTHEAGDTLTKFLGGIRKGP